MSDIVKVNFVIAAANFQVKHNKPKANDDLMLYRKPTAILVHC